MLATPDLRPQDRQIHAAGIRLHAGGGLSDLRSYRAMFSVDACHLPFAETRHLYYTKTRHHASINGLGSENYGNLVSMTSWAFTAIP